MVNKNRGGSTINGIQEKKVKKKVKTAKKLKVFNFKNTSMVGAMGECTRIFGAEVSCNRVAKYCI